MKLVVCLCVLIVAVSAQIGVPGGILPVPFYNFPYHPFGFPASEEYAASLGGAQVGLYGKSRHGPYGFGFPYGYPGLYPVAASEVTGASLGGASVGIYGKERPFGGF